MDGKKERRRLINRGYCKWRKDEYLKNFYIRKIDNILFNKGSNHIILSGTCDILSFPLLTP